MKFHWKHAQTSIFKNLVDRQGIHWPRNSSPEIRSSYHMHLYVDHKTYTHALDEYVTLYTLGEYIQFSILSKLLLNYIIYITIPYALVYMVHLCTIICITQSKCGIHYNNAHICPGGIHYTRNFHFEKWP